MSFERFENRSVSSREKPAEVQDKESVAKERIKPAGETKIFEREESTEIEDNLKLEQVREELKKIQEAETLEMAAEKTSESKEIETADKLETGKKVFDFLERTKLLDIRKSDEQFNEWLQNLSYEDFTNHLTRLNGILREVPLKQRSVDGKGVEISFNMIGESMVSYLPPAETEKDALMRETFDALKNISDNEDRALLMYYTLQSIHPYSDGNGRTGRLLYELLSSEGKELNKEKLSKLLDHDKAGNIGIGEGRDAFAKKVMDANSAYYYINREVAKEMLGNDFMQENGKIFYSGNLGIGRIPKNIELSSEERQMGQKIIGEGDVANFPFRGLTILKLLQENGKLADCRYIVDRQLNEGEVIPEDVGKNILGIDNEKFEDGLTAKDVRRLIEIHKDTKSRFIGDMIDIFENPDKHQLKTRNGREIPIKNAFRR